MSKPHKSRKRSAAVNPVADVNTLIAIADQRSMRPPEASDYLTHVLGCPTSAGYLAVMRVKGGGPLFRRSGRYITYGKQALDLYAQRRLGPELSSTSARAAREAA
jgi:hypothetical protein